MKTDHTSKLISRNIQAYQGSLVIDPSDLETCLIEQPETFWHVADSHVKAIAKRDALKLEIEELHAALDKDIRAEAAKSEAKITEAGIQQRIKDDVDIRDLKTSMLNASQLADEWGALKEAFHQRSYMLRELVAIQLRKLSIESDIASTERDASALRSKQGDVAIKRVKEAREARPARRIPSNRG